MRFPTLHSWDLDPPAAAALQRVLASQVDVKTPLGPWSTVAAADVAYDNVGKTLFAAVVVMRGETFEVIERATAIGPTRFPYVPGLLSFREAPAILEAFEKLRATPDVVLCDGQGIAHPRRIGIASHLGLWLGLPTVGCAKSRLCGSYVEPGRRRGARSPLLDGEDVIGAVVRTRDAVRPLYVSPGHLCDLAGAIALVLDTTRKYRVPVPARSADSDVSELRRAAGRRDLTP